jgi:hypothetical protein
MASTISQGGFMSHRILASAFFACLLAGGAAYAGPKLLENIPLQWTPTDSLASLGPLDLSGPLLSSKIHVDLLVDTRENPSAVAENREKPDKVLPVTTSGNVAQFVTDHLKDTLRGAGLSIVDGPGDVNLSGEIRQFFVAETSMYHGDMSVLVHMKNAQGKEVWSGVILGSAERFGRSYKAENYYEAFSDMVLRAAYNLLSNPGFREALKGH